MGISHAYNGYNAPDEILDLKGSENFLTTDNPTRENGLIKCGAGEGFDTANPALNGGDPFSILWTAKNVVGFPDQFNSPCGWSLSWGDHGFSNMGTNFGYYITDGSNAVYDQSSLIPLDDVFTDDHFHQGWLTWDTEVIDFGINGGISHVNNPQGGGITGALSDGWVLGASYGTSHDIFSLLVWLNEKIEPSTVANYNAKLKGFF